MGEIGRDFRMGFRVLLRSPMVALASVVTLALGIGGTTAVFSLSRFVAPNNMNEAVAANESHSAYAPHDGGVC